MRDGPFRLGPDVGKWVWFVGGGVMALPAIREARRRGYRVLVTDLNREAPGAKMADHFARLSTYDAGSHVNHANSIQTYGWGETVAILAIGSDVGPTVSAVAEVLSLPAESFAVAVCTRNKALMRQALGAPHPICAVLPKDAKGLSDWEEKAKHSGMEPYPCVVKPLEECGSRGFSVVHGPEEMQAALEKANAADRRSHEFVLAEELLQGEEVALDFFAEPDGDGTRLVFANAAKRIFSEPGVEVGHVNPWVTDTKDFEAALAVAARAAEKLGVTRGPFKCDLIRDDRHGWCVLETATRLSGGFDHMLTCPLATGKDVTGAMLDWALGRGVSTDKLVAKRSKFACAWAPRLAPGKVREWHLPWDSEGVAEIVVTKRDEIPPLEDCSSRPVFVVATGDTEAGALRLAKEAADKVGVEYERF